METEGTYLCDACGEEIVIPLDISAGDSQVFVEDCPVCCHPHVLHVQWYGEQAEIRAEAEQDR